MSFQALARTWRPRRFDEIVGQAHVVRALSHALDAQQLHHALLFSGTRGVGKTTLARIIAKCLNCECGVSSQPCRSGQQCGTCLEIDDGRFVDLIEVDAASRTGVDDTRELMDNVQYAPTRGRSKVYLIDEVHMLSKHSFNALLKTLEEPPPRVQFLLATTEPEKIPVTILSRCLQFSLKRLPVVEITGQLRHVVDAGSMAAEADALDEIARAADGSMRDGLSLLDQAIAFGGGTLCAEDVRAMLGTIGQARVAELVDAVVDADAGQAVDALHALYAQGIDMRVLLDALASAWQQIAAIQIVGAPMDDAGAQWQTTAARAEATAVQVFYDIALAGIRDLAYAPDPLIAARMSVLRMLALAPAPAPDPAGAPGSRARSADRRQAHQAVQSAQASQADALADTQNTPGAEPSPAPGADDTREPDRVSAPSAVDETPGGGHPEHWSRLVPRLDLNGFAAQLANHGLCRHLDDQRVVLALARANEFLATDAARDGLQSALARYWQPGATPRLEIEFADRAQDTPAKRNERDARQRQSEAEASIENDPLVARLRERLGAELRPETIKPNRPESTAQQRDDQ